jgi:hypothetical protein
MSLRKGSMRGMDELDTLEVQALLEDYRLAKRREHCSRADFAAGWRAAKLRFEQGLHAEIEHSGLELKRANRSRLKLAV